jgi:hypothetical protein
MNGDGMWLVDKAITPLLQKLRLVLHYQASEPLFANCTAVTDNTAEAEKPGALDEVAVMHVVNKRMRHFAKKVHHFRAVEPIRGGRGLVIQGVRKGTIVTRKKKKEKDGAMHVCDEAGKDWWEASAHLCKIEE